MHIAFVAPRPLEAILAGEKRFEIRCSFRALACREVRRGDTLFLKRVSGDVEAVCEVGDVRMYHRLRPEAVAAIAHDLRDGSGEARETTDAYLARYATPRNTDRSVNVAVVELRNVWAATLPDQDTPRAVRAGWVTLPDPGVGA